MKLTAVVPCYNEEAALHYFYQEMQKVMQDMQDIEFEILFINDGSKDKTLEVIRELAKQDEKVKYVSFSRNFGKEAAIYAGLQYSDGDLTAIMDADLQDPPSLLPQMYRAITEEGYDSVATRRVNRKGEPPIRSFFARNFYRLMNRISRTDIVDGARDYRLMNRAFVDALLEMGEYNRFSKGLFGWVGFETKWLEYENVERVAGETKWSFWKLFLYSIEGIVAFSTMPLSDRTLTASDMFIRPENRMPKPMIICPILTESLDFIPMIMIMPMIRARGAKVDGFKSCRNQVPEELISKRRMICPVIVVPTLAPIMIPRD